MSSRPILDLFPADDWEVIRTYETGEDPWGHGRSAEVVLTDHVNRHFRLLHRPGYSLAVAAIDPRSDYIEQRFVDRAEDAAVFAQQWDGKRNLYIGVNLFPQGHRGGRTALEAAAFQGVLLDLDPDGRGGQLSEPGMLDLLGAVLESVPRVTGQARVRAIEMFSGRGAQACILGEVLALNSDAERRDANEGGKEFLRRIRSDDTIKSILHASNSKLDSTGDLARLMRLAGTVNLKTGERARIDTSAVTPTRSEWFSEYAMSLGGQVTPINVTSIDYGSGPPQLPDWAPKVIQENQLLHAMWEADIERGKRSEHEYRLCHRFREVAQNAGYKVDRDVLAALLWEKPHGKAKNPAGERR